MKTAPKLLATALLLATAPAFAQGDAPAASSPPASAMAVVEPQAVAALEKMGAYLRSLKSFTVRGDSTLDMVTEDGQRLEFPGTVEYQVRMPDAMTVSLKTDRKDRKLYYNGKQLTLFGATNHYYATIDAPPTIRELLATAYDDYGLELPLVDLFLWGTDRAPKSALTSATVVGPARIAGTATEQYAFRQEGVDWQVWIESGSRPLPRRVVITTTDDPARPQYASTLTWNTDATLAADSFTFKPGPEDKRIELVRAVVVEESQPEAQP
jgi:hypothetical protein